MLCLRGRPQDEVGTLNVCAYSSWGNLGNFESKSLNHAEKMLIPRVEKFKGSLDTNVPPS